MKRVRGESREKVFLFVKDCLLRGESPSVREVQAAMGFRAVQSAQEHLDALVKAGRLARSANKSRSYRLPRGQKPPLRRVAILGNVQAGALTTAFEETLGYVAVHHKKADELFALYVKGASMRDAGILEGDIVIVRSQTHAESGEIVVALCDDEATVKRLKYEGSERLPVLYPENPSFAPIYIEPEQLRILGKVIEVRRFYEGKA